MKAARRLGRVLTLISLCLSPGLAAELTVTTAAGERLVALDLAGAPDWCVLWNHSVAGFEVRDCYTHKDGVMLLVSSVAPDFAAGLGHIPGRGKLESDGHGGYLISAIDEPVPGNAYSLRVGSEQVDHRILHGGKTLSLSDLAAGARVTVSLHEKGREAGACLKTRP